MKADWAEVRVRERERPESGGRQKNLDGRDEAGRKEGIKRVPAVFSSTFCRDKGDKK